MTRCDRPSDHSTTRSESWVLVVSDSRLLSVCVAAGLRELGWTSVHPRTAGDDLAAATLTPPEPGCVVLVADRRGALPRRPPGDWAQAVVVAGRCAARAALDLLDGGLTGIVDGDQPFESQVRAVDRALTASAPGSDLPQRAATLGQRAEETARLRRLTRRERDVLDRLQAGQPAAEIAAAYVVALATVRAHIRAILRKLGVPSQLAAVALAHRAGCPGEAVETSQS